jgi:hypothetical protein
MSFLPEDLSLQLTAEGAVRTITVNAFQVWLRTERERWSWLATARQQAGWLKPVLNAQLGTYSSASARVDEVAAKPADIQEKVARGISAELSETIRNRKLLTSEGPSGQFVIELARDRPVVAGHALAALLQIAIPVQDPNDAAAFEGRFRAWMFELGIKDSAQHERNALAATLTEFRTEIEALKTASAAAAASFDTLNASATREISQRSLSFDEAQKEYAAKAVSLIAEHRTALEFLHGEQRDAFAALRTTFLEYMKLKAPVDYWKKSAFWHRLTAAVFGCVAICWGVIFAYNVISYAHEFLAQTSAERATVPFREIGLLFLLVTLAVWLLRVLVRVFLSNLHQSADAASRATMTQAYLALIQEDKKLAETDRILILTTLFRPMATGLIKDDGMPPSLTELFSRIVGGKAGT